MQGHLSAMMEADSGDPALGQDFWFNDHGKAVFKREGDDTGDYGSFLLHSCHKPSECVRNAEDAATVFLFPNPGHEMSYPCGCKCVGVAVPKSFVTESLEPAAADALMRSAHERMATLN